MSAIEGRAGTGTPQDQQQIVLPREFTERQAVAPDLDTAIWLRRHFASGVTVVTTVHDGSFYGVTVSAFAHVSLEPLLVFVSLGKESQTGGHVRASGVFGVSMLTAMQQMIADRFAGRAPLVDRQFREVAYVTATTGAPLLADSIAWLDCRVREYIDGGDHDIYIGEGVAVAEGRGASEDPLLYFNSRYRRLR